MNSAYKTTKQTARLLRELSAMTPSQYTKSRGVKSLRLVSEKTGVSEQTLGNWWKNRRKLFKVIVEGVRSKLDFE